MIYLYITYHPTIHNDEVEIIFNYADGDYCGYFSPMLNCMFFNEFGVLANRNFSQTKKMIIEYMKSVGFQNIKIK